MAQSLLLWRYQWEEQPARTMATEKRLCFFREQGEQVNIAMSESGYNPLSLASAFSAEALRFSFSNNP